MLGLTPRIQLVFLAGLAAGLAVPLPHQAESKQAPAPAAVAPFECRWAEGPITVDGKADEPAWKQAQVIDQFTLPWLGAKARPAKTKTAAKLLWDREYLYFFAEMEDADLYADLKQHDDRLWDNDVFELFFKPADDKPGYYEFQVNPAGAVLDMLIPRRNSGGYPRYKSDGDFGIEVKVQLKGTLNRWQDRDTGWSVEGRMPWKGFLRTGGRPEPNENWKFALCRYDYSVDFEGPELSTCAPLKTKTFPDFHFFEDYAILKFRGPAKLPSKRVGIEQRVPLTTSRVVGSPEPPPPYRVKRVLPNLKVNFPIAVVHQPGSDRLLLIDQPRPYAKTRIGRVHSAAAAAEVELLLDLDDTAYDLTFHPKFADNGYFFVGSNGKQPGPGPKQSRVTRYRMDPNPPYRFDPMSAQVILSWESDGHNGAALCFGKDGMLYVTSGDGTSDSDTKVVGQDMTTLLAKVLRIDVDRPEPGKQYAVPQDNPFVGRPGIRPETWAYGLRNPWRITVDAKTGHLWVGNNGQDLWEQAYLVRKGDNYGWSVYEGSHPFYPGRKLGPTPHVKPTVEHHHSEARSLTGGIVYYGAKYPELHGAYIYGDHSTGKIWGVRHDGTKILWHRELANTTLRITGFGTDPRGELLICDHQGENQGGFYTLVPTPKEEPRAAFPRRLSESGLFRSVKGHVLEPSLVPYTVNAPLWSDGAHKERWLGLPGADSHIDFTTSRGWNFPDETVLVKSFALEREAGNPASRHWIETRFLTKQQGEWVGYSYVWNDEQTDATLVGKEGMDRVYTIKTAAGTRDQKWHYPSRAECMVCHSRAANFVLGLTELQMNRTNDYGGVQVNQLAVLEHLGMLRVNAAEEMKTRVREEAKAKGLGEREMNEYVRQQTATRGQREAKPSKLLSADPSKYRSLVDPYDPKADLTARARSYLHVNCASCHVEAGGGNAQMELDFTTALDKMRLIDVKPVHHTFDLPDARLVAPGSPERSVLLHRIGHRDAGHMPPLATSVVDRTAEEMLREWIKRLPVSGTIPNK